MTYVKINWYEFAVAHNDLFRCLVKAISKHMELKMPSRILLHIAPWVKRHSISILYKHGKYKHGKNWSRITLAFDNTLASSIEKFVSDINIDCCDTMSVDATELIGIIKAAKVKL